jgi:hypothetical protein
MCPPVAGNQDYLEMLRRSEVEHLPYNLEWLPDFNVLLQSLDIDACVSGDELIILNKVIFEKDQQTPRLSEAILNSLWKPIDRAVVFHYTKLGKARSILTEQGLRLHTLLRRLKESEITTFRDFFYPLPSGQSRPDPKSFADSYFYASFSDTTISLREDHDLWDEFAGNAGVRFTFVIETATQGLRRMVYPGNTATSVRDKMTAIRNFIRERADGRDFHFIGSGTSAAFYLPDDYDWENEYRIVTRNPSAHEIVRGATPDQAYILQPFGSHMPSGFNIQLIEIVTDSDLEVYPALKGASLMKRT